MEQIEKITRLNKFIVIKFIENTINDLNTYDWHLYLERHKNSSNHLYYRNNCISFMYDYIDYNFMIGNLESYLVDRYKEKLRKFSNKPLDAFRGFRQGGAIPLNLQSEDIYFPVI